MFDPNDYLTEAQKQEIAEDMFRQQMREHLSNERQVSNHLYQINAELIHEVLDSSLGGDWREQLVASVKGSLKKDLSFTIFRDSDRYTGGKDGPGVAPLREAVEKHAGRIEQRVLRAIEEMDEYRIAEIMRLVLTDRLGGGK